MIFAKEKSKKLRDASEEEEDKDRYKIIINR